MLSCELLGLTERSLHVVEESITAVAGAAVCCGSTAGPGGNYPPTAQPADQLCVQQVWSKAISTGCWPPPTWAAAGAKLRRDAPNHRNYQLSTRWDGQCASRKPSWRLCRQSNSYTTVKKGNIYCCWSQTQILNSQSHFYSQGKTKRLSVFKRVSKRQRLLIPFLIYTADQQKT